ncbi:VOC family protein, partial [Microvirga roseola]|uniref:VOC family protein n=1 Tax=Microvirga roseola TaxID=2883126 RepID=UPI0038992FF8
MRPRISVLTLGIDDLERAVALYRDGLGLPAEGIFGKEFEHGVVAFFDLQSQVKLAVWARDDIAHDTGRSKTALCPTGFTRAQRDPQGQDGRSHEASLDPPPPIGPVGMLV